MRLYFSLSVLIYGLIKEYVQLLASLTIVILFWGDNTWVWSTFFFWGGTFWGLKRKYEEKAKTTLSISSFYDRFTQKMVNFLQRCVLHAIEFQARQSSRVLSDKLKHFKDLVIPDSTIIRLHVSLAKIWLLQDRRESLLA